jgi:hypothetical protein
MLLFIDRTQTYTQGYPQKLGKSFTGINIPGSSHRNTVDITNLRCQTFFLGIGSGKEKYL